MMSLELLYDLSKMTFIYLNMNEEKNDLKNVGYLFIQYLLLRLFCNLVLHFLPETRQAIAATTYMYNKH